MQTFLPFCDFGRTAAVLDVRRLGKQRVETLQILRAITFDDYGWRDHPAVTMWIGHAQALVTYGAVLTGRWRAEGRRDTVLPQLVEFLAGEPLRSQQELRAVGRLPPWLGWEALHRSHRAALVRKDPGYYGPLFPDVDPQMPYVWPAPGTREPNAPVSAWVVRVAPSEIVTLRAHSFVGVRPLPGEEFDVPLGIGRRNTKRRRQLAAFVGEIEIGDRAVVPDGNTLLVGRVAGDYEWWADAPHGLRHARRVCWLGVLPRSQLRQPAHLQDPRLVFALRGEPACQEQVGALPEH